jgi:hypothetical protein
MPEHWDLGKEKPAAAAVMRSYKVRGVERWAGRQHRKEWRPVIRLFRQTTDGDRQPVVTRIAAAVRELAAQPR